MDVYNFADEYGGQDPIASDLIMPMLTRLHALAPGKPVMIAEFGTEYVSKISGDANRRTEWYRDLFATANNNGIKLVAQFNFESNSVFGAHTGMPPNLDGYAALLRNSSWFLMTEPSNPRLIDDSVFAGVQMLPVSYPSSAPTDESSISSNNSSLSIGGIIGVSVGGSVALILLFYLMCFRRRSKSDDPDSTTRYHDKIPYNSANDPELNSDFSYHHVIIN
jgi:hypothetical protein